MSSLPLYSYCKHCGAWKTIADDLKRCSACSEVYYCSKEHQAADWPSKNGGGHKKVCQAVQGDPTCFVVQVESGEGGGVGNFQSNHAFPTKQDALRFIASQLGGAGRVGYPLRSQFAEMLGWHLELYLSSATNEYHPEHQVVSPRTPRQELNSAGIYLTCNISTGLSPNANLNGTMYVIGRRVADGKPVVSDSLWGLISFIWDAMDYYESHGSGAVHRIAPLVERYKARRWEPAGGSARANVYATNPRECGLWVQTVDHRTGVNSSKSRNPTNDQGAEPASAAVGRTEDGGTRTRRDEMVEDCATELMNALRSDLYPSETSECIFGIEMLDANNSQLTNKGIQGMSLGKLIYNVWQEIYKRRLFHAGEALYGSSPGPASTEFVRQVASAIKQWTIPNKFEEWTREVADDEEFQLKVYSTEMKRRGFSTGSGLINAQSEGHRNMMQFFTSIQDRT